MNTYKIIANHQVVDTIKAANRYDAMCAYQGKMMCAGVVVYPHQFEIVAM